MSFCISHITSREHLEAEGAHSMVSDLFDVERSALLFFDMINGHVKKEDPGVRTRYQPVVVNAVRLLSAARSVSMMVAYAAANHRADNGTTVNTVRDVDNRLRPLDPVSSAEPLIHAGTWESQIIDELAPLPADYIVPKYRWNAFFQTYLDLALRANHIDTIVLCGGSTDVGVASTAYAARDADYNLVIVSDACTSPELDNHHQFISRIFPRMARVRTTDEVVNMMSAGTSAAQTVGP